MRLSATSRPDSTSEKGGPRPQWVLAAELYSRQFFSGADVTSSLKLLQSVDLPETAPPHWPFTSTTTSTSRENPLASWSGSNLDQLMRSTVSDGERNSASKSAAVPSSSEKGTDASANTTSSSTYRRIRSSPITQLLSTTKWMALETKPQSDAYARLSAATIAKGAPKTGSGLLDQGFRGTNRSSASLATEGRTTSDSTSAEEPDICPFHIAWVPPADAALSVMNTRSKQGRWVEAMEVLNQYPTEDAASRGLSARAIRIAKELDQWDMALGMFVRMPPKYRGEIELAILLRMLPTHQWRTAVQLMQTSISQLIKASDDQRNSILAEGSSATSSISSSAAATTPASSPTTSFQSPAALNNLLETLSRTQRWQEGLALLCICQTEELVRPTNLTIVRTANLLRGRWEVALRMSAKFVCTTVPADVPHQLPLCRLDRGSFSELIRVSALGAGWSASLNLFHLSQKHLGTTEFVTDGSLLALIRSLCDAKRPKQAAKVLSHLPLHGLPRQQDEVRATGKEAHPTTRPSGQMLRDGEAFVPGVNVFGESGPSSEDDSRFPQPLRSQEDGHRTTAIAIRADDGFVRDPNHTTMKLETIFQSSTYEEGINAVLRAEEDPDRMLAWLNGMHQRQCPVQQASLERLIERCSETGRWKDSVAVMNGLLKQRIVPSGAAHDFTQYAIGVGNGSWETSLRLYTVMDAAGGSVSGVAFKSCVAQCLQHGKDDLAQELLRVTMRRGIARR